jgi:catechol 2,3-dioxygenase-like lactoylglutathione lyase family enzyme
LDRKLDGIDHLIIGVRDLEAARASYARLGFAVAPRGRHVGWGTANCCVMLEDGYLELLGIVDPAAFTNNLDRFLAEREGATTLVLRSRDAEGTQVAWREAGLPAEAPRDLGRRLEAEEGATDLRFRNTLLPASATAGLGVFACQHLTPELLRRPEWLDHPNGARRIRSCTVVVDDPAPLAEAMARVIGSAAVTDTDRVIAVHVGHGIVLIAPPEDAMLMHPAAAIPDEVTTPQLRVVTLEVGDAERAVGWLRQEGVPFVETREGALLPPEQAHGVALELVR